MENLVFSQLTAEDLSSLISHKVSEEIRMLFANKTKEEDDELISSKETAKILKISTRTLSSYMAEGLVKPKIKIEGKRSTRFSKKEILEAANDIESLKYKKRKTMENKNS